MSLWAAMDGNSPACEGAAGPSSARQEGADLFTEGQRQPELLPLTYLPGICGFGGSCSEGEECANCKCEFSSQEVAYPIGMSVYKANLLRLEHPRALARSFLDAESSVPCGSR